MRRATKCCPWCVSWVSPMPRAAVVALLSLARPDFVVSVAIYAVIFFGVAGLPHGAEPDRSRNENIAMISDLFIAAVLAMFVAPAFWR